MAQAYSTGAVYAFIAPTSGGQPVFLGTCESYPEDNRQPEYEPLMNDISGSKVPLDFSFEGESAQISLVLTRWNEGFARRLEAKPNGSNVAVGGTAPSIEGSWNPQDVGSLMGVEGFSWQLWLVRTFGAVLANKAAYVGNGLQPGRHYPQCIIWAPETNEEGAKPMKRHFMFYAWPRLMSGFVIGGPGVPVATLLGSRFVLYDQNYTGITAALIN
jgi:hypothetical protein